MTITEVRINKVEGTAESNEKLLAFASITIDDAFVVRDIKVIGGSNGPFVAMPSRKLTDRGRCGHKNVLTDRFCVECGDRLAEHRAERDENGRAKLHADICHPINAECRRMIQDAVLDAYAAEVAGPAKVA